MTLIERTKSEIGRWLDDTAAAVIWLVNRVASPRTVRLIEQQGGDFVVDDARSSSPEARLRFADGERSSADAGSAGVALRGRRVDLVLQSDRFLFKPLELPARAAEFMDGIVRSQIDRLTPWTAEHSAFGASMPTEAGNGRIVLTVAATAKSVLQPFVAA